MKHLSFKLFTIAFILAVGLVGCHTHHQTSTVTIPSASEVLMSDSTLLIDTLEAPLMTLSVERENGTHQFSVVLGVDPATKTETIKGLHVVDPDGTSQVFNPDNLPQGVVLQKRSGRNVITISSQDFNLETGGRLNLHYLYAAGAFSDSYRDLELVMSKSADGVWQLSRVGENGSLTAFTKMKMLVNTRAFIGVVGIREIITE